MSAVTRVLASVSLRTSVLALAALAGAAPAMAGPDWNDHGRDRWRYGRDDWRNHDRHSSGSASFAIGFSSGFNNCGPTYSSAFIAGSYGSRPYYGRPYYTRPYFAAPICPPPIYTTRYVTPIYEPPVRRVIVESPVVYTQPTQVIYTQPQQVVVQQPAPQVVVQPAPQPQVIVQPAPAPAVVQQPAPIVATTAPAPAAPARVYRDVAPSELSISAYRTGDTIMVLVNGANSMEGYSTSLTVNDVGSDAVLVLHNEPPVVTQNLRNTSFSVNASVRLAGTPATIGVRVADRTYQVPVVDVQSVTGS